MDQQSATQTPLTNLESRVAAVLFKHDPADLTWANVPSDEYLGEALAIIREVKSWPTLPAPSVIAACAYNVFRGSFGTGTVGDSEELVDFGDARAKEQLGTLDDFLLIGEELHVVFEANP